MAILSVLPIVPTGVTEDMLARRASAERAWRAVQQQATFTAADTRTGRLSDPVVPRVPGTDVIQVVTHGHDVIASSIAARGQKPITDVRPNPRTPQRNVRVCGHPWRDCLHVSAVRVASGPKSLVVYVGRATSDAGSTAVFPLLLALQVVAMICLTGYATWKITGRILRPVAIVRAELAAINVNDLSTRIPVPPGDDEITRLVRTVNNTLGRLEDAKARADRALVRQRQFAADASHELRTPITGLRIQLEEAQLHPGGTDLPQVLDRALLDVDRIQAIITDLLLLARIEANTPQALTDIALPELVEAEISRRADRHPVRLTNESTIVVHAIPTQLSRVLTNLLDNAQRHAAHTVEVRVRRNGEHAELSVTDDGTGVPEADRERIFQRFTRLDEARSRDQGGSGLGLAIARDIAHAHHGTLHVEDAPTGGARFVLQLPSPPRTTNAPVSGARQQDRVTP